MKKDFLLLTKHKLRQDLKIRRETISEKRKKEAAQAIFATFEKASEIILSFSSLPEEIDLHRLNEHLAKRKQLILPKVADGELLLFYVENLSEELTLSKWKILEPIPAKCKQASPHDIEIALIPGLGFDPDKHRIGYGKGYYDKLLLNLENALKIGIGFKEQLLKERIPIEPHDQPLDELIGLV